MMTYKDKMMMMMMTMDDDAYADDAW